MYNTRSRANKAKSSASEKPKPGATKKAKSVATNKAKAGSKQKAIRFSVEPKTNKRESAGHQSRSTHRNKRSSRGTRRSSSPRRDFDFPYGVPGLGNRGGFDFGIPMSPFSFYNYPSFGPVGFGQQHHGNVSSYYSHLAKGKRRREPSTDTSEPSHDNESDDDESDEFDEPVVMPAKRIVRSKSCKSDLLSHTI